jgi:hypothetical protein
VLISIILILAANGQYIVIRYECDMCGARMTASDAKRFIVKMEIYAADGPVDLDAQSSDDPRGELRAVIEHLRKADPSEVEDQTYRAFRFDLCDDCRRKLLASPLPPP